MLLGGVAALRRDDAKQLSGLRHRVAARAARRACSASVTPPRPPRPAWSCSSPTRCSSPALFLDGRRGRARNRQPGRAPALRRRPRAPAARRRRRALHAVDDRRFHRSSASWARNRRWRRWSTVAAGSAVALVVVVVRVGAHGGVLDPGVVGAVHHEARCRRAVHGRSLARAGRWSARWSCWRARRWSAASWLRPTARLLETGRRVAGRRGATCTWRCWPGFHLSAAALGADRRRGCGPRAAVLMRADVLRPAGRHASASGRTPAPTAACSRVRDGSRSSPRADPCPCISPSCSAWSSPPSAWRSPAGAADGWGDLGRRRLRAAGRASPCSRRRWRWRW